MLVHCSVLSVFIRCPRHFIQRSSTETGTRRHFGRRRSFGVAGYHFSSSSHSCIFVICICSTCVCPGHFTSILVFACVLFTYFFFIFLIYLLPFRFSCVRALRSLSAFKQISSSYDTRLSSLVRFLGRDSRCRVWMVEWDDFEIRMDGFSIRGSH